jgi:outer membrane protein OmpA-like peptidoglycan-associated protein
MTTKQRTLRLSALCALGATTLACSQTPPAKTYTEAEKTYTQAEDGYAQEYAPDELLEARKLLDDAASAKNGSAEQEHLGYLADRQARLAASSGTIEYYQNEKSQAQARYIKQIESERLTAKENLEETRDQLSKVESALLEKDANVEELQARKAELEKRRNSLESELTAKQAALTESEKARADAEERAAAAIASLNELANVKEEANETVITLSGSVLFKTGKAELLPLAENKLAKVADALKQLDDEQQIVVEGHTDSRGSSEMNQELSQKRAESVQKYLASQGVNSSRLKAVGKGEQDPIADNNSPEGRANNRRVELRITRSDKSGAGEASAQAQTK